MLFSITFGVYIFAALTNIGRIVAQQPTASVSAAAAPTILLSPSEAQVGGTYEITYAPVHIPVRFFARRHSPAEMNSENIPLSMERATNGSFTWEVGPFFRHGEIWCLTCSYESILSVNERYVEITALYSGTPMASSSWTTTPTPSSMVIMMPYTSIPPTKNSSRLLPAETNTPSGLPATVAAGIGIGAAVAAILLVLAGCVFYKRYRRKGLKTIPRVRVHLPWRNGRHPRPRTKPEEFRPEFKSELDGKALITVCFCEMNANVEAQELPATERIIDVDTPTLREDERAEKEEQRRDSLLTSMLKNYGQEVSQEEDETRQKQEESK
ncbi:hypothetical protein P154DRAFT_569059 [Amniculicola lignicola CBS 123094]|uniref:Mid2 domain-containing protein n=1 Tax=Amniculicola lignicola CBS 123094 TaxID=1392246 RepID=A0A6A5X305_9PLEO|nr:hypothetical protein P154DRAFT_569059 [Amniculicola lignicola CBS 123094]